MLEGFVLCLIVGAAYWLGYCHGMNWAINEMVNRMAATMSRNRQT